MKIKTLSMNFKMKEKKMKIKRGKKIKMERIGERERAKSFRKFFGCG